MVSAKSAWSRYTPMGVQTMAVRQFKVRPMAGAENVTHIPQSAYHAPRLT